MNRWKVIDRLFERALDVPVERRLGFVVEQCGEDDELRAELESLLTAHEASREFLSEPSLINREKLDSLAAETAAPSARVGDRIGSWRIAGEIGRGGMATVYRAERMDREFEQIGALKLLRRGLDTEDILRRFRGERQILSSLDHPNIAGLLDGGSTRDGRPYLVMECVDGVPMATWCDEHSCTVEERLRLFLAVARAVQHAHTRLVVHRDLKPSNILVTPDGHVKLLDFGIAKLLDPSRLPADVALTGTGQRALTPEYASPEQLRGDAVTTSTDVYQLGLLLHRLLSGARPRELRETGDGTPLNERPRDTTLPTAPSRTPTVADAVVAAARRLSPRRLEQRLRGDLDTIVLTALRPEVEARYGSVLEMARDVEHHLDGLPISARAPTVAYRTRKFMLRHPWLAPTAAAIAGIVGLYVATLSRHGRQLETERNAARHEAARAETVRDVLVGVFQGTTPWLFEPLPRSGQATVLQSLDVGVERAGALDHEPAVQVDLYTVLAGAYMGIGHPDRATPLVRDGLRLRAALDGPRSRSVAGGLRQLGRALASEGHYDTASVALASSVDMLRASPLSRDTMLLGTLIDLAWVEKLRGHLTTTVALLTEVVDASLADPEMSRDFLAQAYSDLGVVFALTGDHAKSREAAELALDLQRERFGEGHPETAIARSGLAGALWRTSHDDFSGVIERQKQATETLRATLGADHPHTLTARLKLGMMMQSDGRIDEAKNLLRASVARHLALFGSNDPRTGQAQQWYASILYQRGDLEEARVEARSAYEVLSGLEGAGAGVGLGENVLLLCGIAIHLADHATALDRCREATDVFGSAGMESGYFGALAECRLGHVVASEGQQAEAAALFERAVPIVWSARTVFFPGDVHECLAFASTTYEATGRGEEAARLRLLAEQTPRRGLPGVIR